MNAPLKILVAGGGTGSEPLLNAIRFPQSEIKAIDLSKSSLAYAKMKAEDHDIKNVLFEHMDILDLAESKESYDLVASSGVLHHMKEPMKGWRIICDRLKPEGLMKIGLYSKTARRHIEQARNIIRGKNLSSDRDSMLTFRKDIASYLDPKALKLLQGMMDYYNLSMFRDLLFHTQEYCYDLPEIEQALSDLGLTFLGFEIDAKTEDAYRQMFPKDPEMTSLKNWHAFEQKNPDAFLGMYQFWCQKN